MNSTPLQSFLYHENHFPERIFLRQPLNDTWYPETFREAGEKVRKLASWLRKKAEPKSKIVILSKNCAEWIISDLAIMMADLISVPIYPTLSSEGIKPIIEHCEPRIVIVGKLDNFDKQRSAIYGLPVVSFDRYGIREGTLLSQILSEETLYQPEALPGTDDLLSIMYSSGTTGFPKGVMLSHGAFAFVGDKVSHHLGLTKPEKFFSYLPLSHIAERGLMEMVALHCGGTISFTESLDKFAENLQHERPTVFGGVPRIYAKFQEGILNKIPQNKLDRLLSIPVLSFIIKKVIRKKLGFGRAKVIVSGAAPTPVTLIEWFAKLGIEVREMYGMTENTAFSHANYKGWKIGSVGQAWPEAECRLSDDKEVELRHPALMKGYYKDPETTSLVFTSDGFLRTGDKGELDNEGFLTITGRLKDQFKTDKAKFIAPAPIELRMLANSIVEQVCVVGTGLPQPIALVVLSAGWQNFPKEQVTERLRRMLREVNPDLENYERLEKLVIMNETWTIENGMLTPSLKLKRNELEKRHQTKYQEWFKNIDIIVWAE